MFINAKSIRSTPNLTKTRENLSSLVLKTAPHLHKTVQLFFVLPLKQDQSCLVKILDREVFLKVSELIGLQFLCEDGKSRELHCESLPVCTLLGGNLQHRVKKRDAI